MSTALIRLDSKRPGVHAHLVRKHLPSGAFVESSGWSDGQPCLVVSGIEIDEAVEVSEQAATALSKHIQRPVADVARDLLGVSEILCVSSFSKITLTLAPQ